METTNMKRRLPIALIVLSALLALPAAPALAGRGWSAQAIQGAIASGSFDAIAAELERAERLLCGACVRLVEPLVDHDDARVRRVAGWWLARRGLRSELFVQMSYRLAQPDSRLARNAADVLGSLRYHRAVEPLTAALHNPTFNAEARAAMAAALGRIGEPAAGPGLVQALRAPEAGVRAAALEALRELRAPLDTSPVLALLADGDEGVRGEAAYTVGATRGRLDPAAREAATQALVERAGRETKPAVRRKLVWALGEIAAPASLAGKRLRDLALVDEDASVRALSRAALGRLTP